MARPEQSGREQSWGLLSDVEGPPPPNARKKEMETPFNDLKFHPRASGTTEHSLEEYILGWYYMGKLNE